MRDSCEAVIEAREYDSPAGKLVLCSYRNRLIECDWKEGRHRAAVRRRRERLLPQPVVFRDSCVIDTTLRQLEEYFRGTRRSFDIDLLFLGSPFQRTVWEALTQISYGTTLTYGKLSERIGKPSAVRAVANAVGANPLSVLVPCHRILGVGSTLTGYGGGLEAKRYLLDLERIAYRP